MDPRKIILALSIGTGFFLNQQAMADDQEDFGTVVRQFSAAKHQSEEDLAKQLSLPISKDVEDFFKAAEAGDSLGVSNQFCLKLWGEEAPRPEYQNELWAPVFETLGVHDIWIDWKKDSRLVYAFAESVMASMPAGSIYFGGTDEGRFFITAVNTIRHPPPIFCLTQNALVDTTYMACLRTVYGKQIWIPSTSDAQRAFQQYAVDLQKKIAQGQSIGPGEHVDIAQGQMQVRGIQGVMKINGILCQFIHDHNKDRHEFYVEESYVLDWMYPYLEPHGLIMKLNKDPLTELSAKTIAQDTAFWKEKTDWLLRQPDFAENPSARLAFAKLRCAIARIYVFRQRDDDAERALRQALQLCALSPEANLELAKLDERRGQSDQAIARLREFIPRAQAAAAADAKAFLNTLENKHPLTPDEHKLLLELIQQLGAEQSNLRKEARQKIVAFGPRALPLLRDQANNKDPEISTIINDLILQLRADDQGKAAD